MQFGTVSGDERRFLYSIEHLDSSERNDWIYLIVTDFNEKQWKSSFKGQHIIDNLKSDVVPAWSVVKEKILDAIQHSLFEIDEETGVLNCPFEIIPGLQTTLKQAIFPLIPQLEGSVHSRLPPKERWSERCSSDISADFALSLFQAWKTSVTPSTHEPSLPVADAEEVDVAMLETPVKPKRSVGKAKVVHSTSRKDKTRPRRLSLRPK